MFYTLELSKFLAECYNALLIYVYIFFANYKLHKCNLLLTTFAMSFLFLLSSDNCLKSLYTFLKPNHWILNIIQ